MKINADELAMELSSRLSVERCQCGKSLLVVRKCGQDAASQYIAPLEPVLACRCVSEHVANRYLN